MNHDTVAWDVQTKRLGPFTYILELTKVLFQYRPCIIIAFGPLDIFSITIYSLFSRKFKYIAVITSDFGFYGGKSIGRFLHYLHLKALGISLRLSQGRILVMLSLSKYAREGIRKLANLNVKFELISYPIHPEFSDKPETSPSRPSEEPILLTMAGIEPRKGLDTLIKAIPLIPNKFRVLIMGSVRDAGYMHRLNDMVNSLNLREKVTFSTEGVDYDSLAQYYKSATLFVLPTRGECLGVVVLEALCCGLPVVATSVGGIPDMIDDGVNGILVQPDDPTELANAISSILDNESLRRKLAANARRTLQKRYYEGRITLRDALIHYISKIRDRSYP
jgi:glycosyltransferase involved in cell wall biosynthesis